MDVEAIRTIPIVTRVAENFWAWHVERCGIFTVKSAYRMIIDTKRRREAWLERVNTPAAAKGTVP